MVFTLGRMGGGLVLCLTTWAGVAGWSGGSVAGKQVAHAVLSAFKTDGTSD